MLTTKTTLALLFVFLVGPFTLSGCASPPAPPSVAEQPPAEQKPQEPNPSPQPAAAPELPPARPEDVQAAVTRIFKGAVVVDSSRTPAFLFGDFNGDLSQDLAVIIMPADGKLSELNQEFPNWIAREPLSEVLPKPKLLAATATTSQNPAAGQTVRFEQGDVLLAIIHGNGSHGWRDPDATQTHLLRNVVGTDLRLLPRNDVGRVYRGTKPFPTIYGDLLQETLIGQSGFVHFKGGVYGWYDRKNYRQDIVPMAGHVPVRAMK